jgi:predicted amidohydrolase
MVYKLKKMYCKLKLFLTACLILSSIEMNSQAPTHIFRLALVQMYVEPGALQKNLDHAAGLISEAADGGADVVLLPEVMDLADSSVSQALADSVPGGVPAQPCKAARDNNVYLCAGIVERDDRIFNAAVIIDNEGNVLLKHRKLNELDIAHDVYDQETG